MGGDHDAVVAETVVMALTDNSSYVSTPQLDLLW